MSTETPLFYEFGPFRLDVAERVLLREGRPVALTLKAFETLLVLVRNRGHIVEKDMLMRAVWPDTVVEEGGLNVNVFRLRKALGDTSDAPRYIETVPRRGYRFIAEVRTSFAESAAGGRVEDEGQTHAFVENAPRTDAGKSPGAEAPAPRAAGAFVPPRRAWTRRWLWASGAAVVLLVGGLAVASYLRESRPPRPPVSVLEVKSLAVLPFETMGGAGDDEYLGQGMADALITKLSNIRQVAVRPTSAVLKYARAGRDLTRAADELRVDALLEGRIQKSGERVRVTVQLVRGGDGVPLWAETFDEKWTDIFAVQDSISERVTRSLTLKLTGGEETLVAKRYTENAEAFELYLRGRYFWNKRTAEGLRRGIEHFEKAIAKDPSYALAYVGLADSYILLGVGDYSVMAPREAMLKAKEAATRALERDDTLAEAHASLGFLNYVFDWDWPAAEAQFRRAIELNPNYATAHHWYSLFLTVTGRAEEGIAEAERALALDPLSLIINTDLGLIYHYTRRFDLSAEQLRKTLEIEPNFAAARWRLGRSYTQMKMYDEAVAEFEKAMELEGRSPVFLASLGYAHAAAGRRAEALRIQSELKEMSRRRYVAPHQLGAVALGLGQKDEALDLLEKSYEERSNALVGLKVEPTYDVLRAEPRFDELLRRMRLDDAP